MTRLPPLRAPAEDGGVLAVPPLEHAGRVIAENRDRLGRVHSRLLGREWQDVRRLARRELVQAAEAYLAGESSKRQAGEDVLLLAGHQPELFHPGVWVKNFALAGMARRHGATAVHLLVDNDTVKSTSLHLPAPGDPFPESRTLPFDAWQGETPWEERRVHDLALFDRFGDDGSDLLRQWGYEPLLSSFWPEVRQQAALRQGHLGDAFAAARRSLERAWGCANLELPLSHVCRGEAFAWFAGHLLADLPRFAGVYNTVVRDHRRKNRIRSRNHPVPDLASEGDWLEAPLWGWKASQPRRGRLFARVREDRLELRAGREEWPALPAPTSGAERFIDAWRGLESAGYKVRSRALITTMFSRLLLSDLFVHGIGGGKYDELTDALIPHYWGLEPPHFLVLSATCHLPVPTFSTTQADRRWLSHRLRDLQFNPQRHLPPRDEPALSELAQARAEWVRQSPPTRAGRRERFREIRRLSDELRPAVDSQLDQARQDLDLAERRLAANGILRRRDYSFCLYPESAIRAFCAGFS